MRAKNKDTQKNIPISNNLKSQPPAKNAWVFESNESPFGFFKNIFKNENLQFNDDKTEVFPQTKNIIMENKILNDNEIFNCEYYQSKLFEIYNKYKDFILEKEILDKLKSLETSNNLIEKGIQLLENIQNQKNLKNYDQRNNYILISFEIRKIFIDLLKTFNNLSDTDSLATDFLNIDSLKQKENNIGSALGKTENCLKQLEIYLKKKLEEPIEKNSNETPKSLMEALIKRMKEKKFIPELMEVFQQKNEKYKSKLAEICNTTPLEKRKDLSYLDCLIEEIFVDCEGAIFTGFLLEIEQEFAKKIPDKKIFEEFFGYLKAHQRSMASTVFYYIPFQTTKELCEKHYQEEKNIFLWSMVKREKECLFCSFGEENKYLIEDCPKCKSKHYVLHGDCGSTGKRWNDWFCFDCRYSYSEHFD